MEFSTLPASRTSSPMAIPTDAYHHHHHHHHQPHQHPHQQALPPLAFHSISPPNTAMRHTDARLPSMPKCCRLLGCANFAKIHGYCPEHYQTTPEAHAQMMPPRRFECSMANVLSSVSDRPMMPPQPVLPSFDALRLSVLTPPTMRRFSDPSAHSPATASHSVHPMATASPPRHFSRLRAHSAASMNRHSPASSPSSTTTTGSSKAFVKCRRENCSNVARRKGLCMEHGGRHFCKMEGCQKCAHRGGYCIAHGGGRRCAVENCTKSAQSGGVCYSHGGGKRCATDGCTHAARSGGFCIKHGKMVRQGNEQELA
ncbi:hypothetical protein Poli38472_002821 [Pythium oligandrum]|uniref:WRKY19-like zinc finger domain-containing protein n=1 Tax=Pythium oligandrum TaxID=41045 RepID=A0A8K1FC79_PYTOL|nr:hypothetical protein Poli38472_002821 [Pythium oligandrum]|eukprot:TMW56896.1 hypothetical protein Poli38472_002821 [Pythium oligandrum]